MVESHMVSHACWRHTLVESCMVELHMRSEFGATSVRGCGSSWRDEPSASIEEGLQWEIDHVASIDYELRLKSLE